MVCITARYSTLSAPAVVEDLEQELYDVLRLHYYVKCTRFEQIDPYDVVKHEMYHLSKAISKVQLAIDLPIEENLSRLRKEVAPDMVIYALECSMAFQTDWWRPLLRDVDAPTKDLLGFLAGNQDLGFDPSQQTPLRTILSTMVHAVGRLGEFCDRHDHSEKSAVDLGSEVVLPFMQVALSLARHLAFDLDAQFGLRLIDVANRYVGLPDTSPHKTLG
jgi:hypothetical protein